MRNIFLYVSERLNDLMKTQTPPIIGKKRAPTLARLIHEAGLHEDVSEKSMERSIDNHLNGCRMGIDYLKLYCDFFGCSADYLLGYIPEKTHELTDIAEATGLSKGAIECLKEMDEESKAVLNYLLDGYDAPIWPLLYCMSIFESRHAGSMKALHDLLDNPESTDTQADYIKAKQAEDLSDHDVKEYCDQVIENWKKHVEGRS